MDEELEFVLEIARAEGAIDIVVEEDADARARLWKARHDVAYATSAASPGRKHRATDTCVPLSHLAAHAAFARTALDEAGVVGAIIGHAGDGNLHVDLMVDPGDPDEVAVALGLTDRLVEDALSRGGTATGEHGIGLGKRDALALEHPDLLPLYRGIKELFDPRGIMNPGKILRP